MPDYEDDLIQLDPEAGSNPHLKTSGWYGQGTELGGDAEIFELQWPIERELPERSFPNDPYVQWVIKVNHPDFGTNFTRCFPQSTQPGTGSRNQRWLENAGVPFEEIDGKLQFRKSDVEGRKVAVLVKEPRTADGVSYTGDFTDLRGV